jgi:hypothetical protein
MCFTSNTKFRKLVIGYFKRALRFLFHVEVQIRNVTDRGPNGTQRSSNNLARASSILPIKVIERGNANLV